MRAGQLVEVLDDSGSNWMVLTIAMATGDLETEGFLPAHILRPTGMPLNLYTVCNVNNKLTRGDNVCCISPSVWYLLPHAMCK